MEREQISERTNLGIKEALEKGVYAIGGSLPVWISKNSEGYLFYNRVKNLYIKGIIDEVEAKTYYKKIEKHKESINIINCIDSLKIYCNGCFNIKLKSN